MATIMISNSSEDLVGTAVELKKSDLIALVCSGGCICRDCIGHMHTCIFDYGEGQFGGSVEIEGTNYGEAEALYLLSEHDEGYICSCCGTDCTSF